MKKKKLIFDKVERFKELIELTGLTGYSVESDDGRDMILSLSCTVQGNEKKDLHEFVYDFHADRFQFWPGECAIQVVKDEIEINWKESRNLIYEEVESDFYLLCNRLFSMPSDAPLDQILSFQFEINGSITNTLLIDQFVFIVQFDKLEINEYGFTAYELKRMKRGVLFHDRSRLRAIFEKGLRGILRQYKVANSTFSLSGDECFLRTFDSCQIREVKFILSNE